MTLLQNLLGQFAAWQKRSQVEAELNAFSDRELADIGIGRSDIADLVRQKVPSLAGHIGGDADALTDNPSAN